MDTITHGIAGALLGKALFRGEDMLLLKPMNRARIVTWSLMLGAIFPDIDIVRDIFSRNELLVMTWHRSVTHSWLCLPIWALLLAALTRWIAARFHWDAPSFRALTALYAVGIASHIFLDLVTTFGTMIWSPLSWSRPAWDILFIIDFTFAGLLLIPQMLAWANSNLERARIRSLLLWLIFVPTPFLVAGIAKNVGTPISEAATLIAVLILTLLFLLPAYRGFGAKLGVAGWNRVGFAASCVYLLLAVFAHHEALQRMHAFAALENIQAEAIGALPFPPSLWHWDGLILTPRGVYEMRMDLSSPSPLAASNASNSSSTPETKPADGPPIEYHFYPSAPSNRFIDAAKALPEVQAVLWFDRFPVTRFRMEGEVAVVEILDLRFPPIRRDRPASFTYRVRLDSQGNVLSKGLVRR